MASTSRIEAAIGTVDGVNATFSTSVSFKPGSVVPHLNGQALPSWKVSEGPGNTFTVSPPPRTGDDVQVYFRTVL